MSQTPNAAAPLRPVDRYFCFWALFLPITSFLVIPSVQGTTIGYLLAILLAVSLPILSQQGVGDYYKTITRFVVFFLILAILSQTGLMVMDGAPDTWGLLLIRPGVTTVYMRPTLLTQSFYLFCTVSLFAFVRVYYTPKWDKYFYIGAALLALYGIFEWGYFLATGSSGDFISNRVFSADEGIGLENGKEGSGSLFQTLRVGPLSLMRLKSLTGEPSMYAFTMLPFWVYATHMRRWGLSALFLITLLLSASTTAYLGILVYAVCTITDRKTLPIKVVLLLLIGGILLLYRDVALETIDYVFLDKMDSQSGLERTDVLWNQLNFFMDANIWVQLWGLGFGYTRGMSLITTLLVNCGVVGLTASLIFFFYPVFKMGSDRQESAIRHALIVLFVAAAVAVPEFSYLPLWLFLGLGYSRLRTSALESRQRAEASTATLFSHEKGLK